jgi:hypothetical protein
MSINISAFIASLKYMVEGWLGIFIVMGIIIAVVHGLNKFGTELEKKMSDKQ